MWFEKFSRYNCRRRVRPKALVRFYQSAPAQTGKVCSKQEVTEYAMLYIPNRLSYMDYSLFFPLYSSYHPVIESRHNIVCYWQRKHRWTYWTGRVLRHEGLLSDIRVEG